MKHIHPKDLKPLKTGSLCLKAQWALVHIVVRTWVGPACTRWLPWEGHQYMRCGKDLRGAFHVQLALSLHSLTSLLMEIDFLRDSHTCCEQQHPSFQTECLRLLWSSEAKKTAPISTLSLSHISDSSKFCSARWVTLKQVMLFSKLKWGTSYILFHGMFRKVKW